VLLLLVVVGVSAAVARILFVDDLGSRTEPARSALLDAAGLTDPHAARRATQVEFVDARFGSHPVLALAHVGLGAVFLALAPLQFSGRFRARHLRLHRWAGRLLIVAALASTLASLYFGLWVPFGGWREAVAIAAFAALFLFSLGRGFVAIRARDVALHREWMIRSYAVAVGISTVRVVIVAIDLPLTMLGIDAVGVFLIGLWSGWILTVAAAEAWIRRTRLPAPVTAVHAA
jgi:hypothetical protein